MFWRNQTSCWISQPCCSLTAKLYMCGCPLQVLMHSSVCALNKGSANTHTHIFKALATRLLLQRRRINAVRTQCQCNVFVYFGSEALAPPEQPDSPFPSTTPTSPGTHPGLSFHNWSGGVAVFPEGLRHGNFFSPPPPPFFFYCLSLSVSCLLLLFAQDLNVLVQTLFLPPGRAAPYARPVKAAVVMDTGKHQNKMSTTDSWGSVTLHLSSFFFPASSTHPLFFTKSKTPVKLSFFSLTLPLPLDASRPEVQCIQLCWAALHSVPFRLSHPALEGSDWSCLPGCHRTCACSSHGQPIKPQRNKLRHNHISQFTD